MQRKQKNKNKARKLTSKRLEQLVQGLSLPHYALKVWRDLPPPIPRAPKGPHPGAVFSTRQLANTFGTYSGLSNVGATAVAQLVVNSPTAVYVSIAFRLDDLGQYSTFASLFDQYRIDKVHLRFYARNNALSTFNTASPNGAVPLGYITPDRDDATAPASIDAVRQYDLAQAFTGSTSFDIEMEVRPTAALYASGAFSGYNTLDLEPWIDIANTDVPHYGVKAAVSGLTTSTTSSWVWDIEAHYFVSFRNPR